MFLLWLRRRQPMAGRQIGLFLLFAILLCPVMAQSPQSTTQDPPKQSYPPHFRLCNFCIFHRPRGNYENEKSSCFRRAFRADARFARLSTIGCRAIRKGIVGWADARRQCGGESPRRVQGSRERHNEYGSSALMYAAVYADTATMKLLLSRGVDPSHAV